MDLRQVPTYFEFSEKAIGGALHSNEVTEQNIVSIKKDLYNRLTLVKVLSETANTAR